jgi:phospholipase/lecithinase/hemolysin
MAKLSTAVVVVVLGLTACTGTDEADVLVNAELLKGNVSCRQLISFGDSLSDVGSYSVGAVKALGGGKFTVNSPRAKIWAEVLAAELGLTPPCAAQTGLDGDASLGFFAPVATFPACTNYAQGGSRVTDPIGAGNKLLGGVNATVGLLTVPVVTQIENHLALHGDTFGKGDLVSVFTGGNDVFVWVSAVGAGENPANAIVAMVTAATELGGYVKDLILANGAEHVLVMNVPDITATPLSMSFDAATQGLIDTLVTTFNSRLEQELAGSAAQIVDVYGFNRRQRAHPERFDLANTTRPACDLTPAVNPLGSSLICTQSTLVADADPHDVSSDATHPTPYQHRLLAEFVSRRLSAAFRQH